MQGRPVWLASISRRSRNGRVVSALKLPRRLVDEAVKILERVLHGVGDTTRERTFQMCITTCMHRALTDEEIAKLPEGWMSIPPQDIAGGPVRTLSSKGIPETPSVEPCENYARKPLPGLFDADDDPLWVPIECGDCEPCRAREAAAERSCSR